MKMASQKIFLVLFILCLVGCVPSLHQLYTEKTLVYDPAIVGNWQQDDELWGFVGDPNDRSYHLTITEKEDKTSKLLVHLVEVGGRRFFDFYPDKDAELEGGTWLKFSVIPVHLFLTVDKTEQVLTLAVMDPDEADKLLAQKPGLVKHERVEDGQVVLTDTPERLQAFLLEGLKVEGFFGKPFELTQAKSAEAEP